MSLGCEGIKATARIKKLKRYNYDEAINAILKLADQTGIALQHTSFGEFSEAMRRKDVFILE